MNINTYQTELEADYSEQSEENIIFAYKRFQDALVSHSNSAEYLSAIKEWAYFRSYTADISENVDEVINGAKCICGVKIFNIFQFKHVDDGKRISIGCDCLISLENDMESAMKARMKVIRSVFSGSSKYAFDYCKTNHLLSTKHIDFVEDIKKRKYLQMRDGNKFKPTKKQKTYYKDIIEKAKALFKKNPHSC